MIASLWANSNYDDDKGTRQNAITELEEKYQQTVRMVIDGEESEEEEDIENNPFFASTMESMKKLDAIVSQDLDGTVQDNIAPLHEAEIDQ